MQTYLVEISMTTQRVQRARVEVTAKTQDEAQATALRLCSDGVSELPWQTVGNSSMTNTRVVVEGV